MRLVKLCLACGQLLPSLLFQYPIAWKFCSTTFWPKSEPTCAGMSVGRRLQEH